MLTAQRATHLMCVKQFHSSAHIKLPGHDKLHPGGPWHWPQFAAQSNSVDFFQESLYGLKQQQKHLHLQEGRKDIFYLTTHSTHLVTVIWRQTYGKGPFRQRERKPTSVTWAILSDQQQVFFYMHHPTDRIAHTTAFVTSSRRALAGTRNSFVGRKRFILQCSQYILASFMHV